VYESTWQLFEPRVLRTTILFSFFGFSQVEGKRSLWLVNTSSIASGSHVQVLIFFDSWLLLHPLICFLVGDEGSCCRDLIGIFPNPSLF
jgi:hypothetical protein